MLCALLVAAGCDQQVEGTAKQDRGVDNPGKDDTSAVPADNTKKNERDRDPAALTPGDQGESEADRTITQNIRRAVVGKDGLSLTAKNVKIITRDGITTLRGPVKSEQEKAEIGALAQGVEGVKRVDNQLEVAAP